MPTERGVKLSPIWALLGAAGLGVLQIALFQRHQSETPLLMTVVVAVVGCAWLGSLLRKRPRFLALTVYGLFVLLLGVLAGSAVNASRLERLEIWPEVARHVNQAFAFLVLAVPPFSCAVLTMALPSIPRSWRDRSYLRAVAEGILSLITAALLFYFVWASPFQIPNAW